MRKVYFLAIVVIALGVGAAGCKKKPAESKKGSDPGGEMAEGAMEPGERQAPEGGFPKLDCRQVTDQEKQFIKKDAEGRVVQCYLAKPMTIDGVKCREEGYRTFLYPSGRLKECMMVDGFSKTFGKLKCQRSVKLYPDGALEYCVFVDKIVKVDEVECKMSAELHPNGKLRNCQSAGSATIGKVTVGAESYLTFDDKGVLKVAGMRKHPYSWKEHKCKYAHFWPSGSVKTCEIDKKLVIDGKELPVNVTLCFSEQGDETKELSKEGYVCGDLKDAEKKVKDLAAKLKKAGN